ncbi:MAG: hypothetical protein ACOC1F_04220 [Myxococcota bacterium]
MSSHEAWDQVARVLVQHVRRQGRIGAAVLATCLVTMFALPFVAGTLAWLPIVVGMVGAVGAFSYLVGLQRGPGERLVVPGHYRLNEESLWVWEDGTPELVIAPDVVQTGWCEAARDGTTVILQLRDGRVVAIEPRDQGAVGE